MSAWAAGGEEASEGAEGPSNAEFVAYSKHLNKMTMLETRMKEIESRLRDLIRKKNSGVLVIKDDKNNTMKVLDVIVEQHKALLSSYSQYNEELRTLTYRFPEKGEEIKRRYIPFRPKSLDQIEREMGLDGDLTALKAKVDAKYRTFMESEAEAKPGAPMKARTPASPTKKEDEPERLRLVK